MNPNEIIECVCQWYQITQDELIADYQRNGKRDDSRKHTVHARWVAMHLLSDYCSLSNLEVGVLLKRDQSTVSHGINQVRYRIDADPAIKDGVFNVEYLIKAKQFARLKQELGEIMTREI